MKKNNEKKAYSAFKKDLLAAEPTTKYIVSKKDPKNLKKK
jgi:hypothetical protein